MYKAVQTTLQVNGQSWSEIPAFVAAQVLFTSKISLLEDHIFEQETVMRGVTADKRKKREEAARVTLEVAKAIAAYAARVDNPGLAKSVQVSRSKIIYTTHIRTLNMIDAIIEKGTEHLNVLEDFGIDQEKMDELQTLRDELETAVGTPRQAILSRKAATQLIKSTIKEIDAILKGQLDNLVESLRWSVPDLYLQYSDARVIYSYGTRHSDTEDGSPTQNDDYEG